MTAGRLLICILFILQSCNNSPDTKMAASEKIKIGNHGVNIDYRDSKSGQVVLFFIHGWGINQTYWEKQIPHFSKNYRVVTIDLPGFGKSGKNRKIWTVEEYSRDINTVLEKLDLKNVILIGHSMSGSIIVETALTNPSRIIGVVGVDNLKDIGVEMTPQMEKEWDVFYTNARNDFKSTVSTELAGLFSPSTGEPVKRRVSQDILSADPAIAIDCLKNLDKYPFAKKLQSMDKPLWLINSDYRPTDTSAFRKNKIEFNLLEIPSTGHYPMLEKPHDFNLLLGRAIEKILSGKRAPAGDNR